jgi:hypothetical protein
MRMDVYCEVQEAARDSQNPLEEEKSYKKNKHVQHSDSYKPIKEQ